MGVKHGQRYIISIHAPGKGATCPGSTIQPASVFQSTLPGRERPPHPAYLCYVLVFQSTLPGRERHVGQDRGGVNVLISIHAPGKGATGRYDANRSRRIISIHAPGKGATISTCFSARPIGFQSTLPGRERPAIKTGRDAILIISIHAPGKGATRLMRQSQRIEIISIHAPGKGAT